MATGKYLFLMDSDDILDLNALELTYDLAEQKDVDFVLFQAINYYMDKDEYLEEENYSMNALADYVKDSVFSYKDIRDFVFDITVTPWSKLYNRQFIESNNITFPEGLVFDDNVFFYDVLFAAQRITFLRKHLFKRRWYPTSSTRAGDLRFLNYIDICNLIWDVFYRYGEFDYYRKQLFTKKVGTIYYWYKNIKDQFKETFFCEMRKDYLKLTEDEKFLKYFLDNLDERQKVIFESVVEAETRQEFDLMIENYELEKENRHLKELLDRPIHKLAISKLRK